MFNRAARQSRLCLSHQRCLPPQLCKRLQSSSNQTSAVVIVDHGSRRKESNDMLLEFCKLYQSYSRQQIVEPAHMEIAEPTIEQAIARCQEQGARQVVVAPYFLSRGRHIQEDIPALVDAAQKKYPGIECVIAEPIGIDLLMAELINNRVAAALKDRALSSNTAQQHG